MNKIIIPSIFVAVLLTAVFFAVMPVEKASTVHTALQASVRDNVIINDITLTTAQRIVLVDNAGIGGRSDVEITWRFDATECQLQTFDGTTFNPVTPDSPPAFGGNPQHRDVTGVEAVLLVAQTGQTCDLTAALGEFVTVSTVKATP